MTREERKQLKENGILYINDNYCPCDARGYIINEVFTTRKLWEEHKNAILPNTRPGFKLHII